MTTQAELTAAIERIHDSALAGIKAHQVDKHEHLTAVLHITYPIVTAHLPQKEVN
jgi:hypothetical protein